LESIFVLLSTLIVCFNPATVRLELKTMMSDLQNAKVSTPQRFDWNPSVPRNLSEERSVSTPQRFDWNTNEKTDE